MYVLGHVCIVDDECHAHEVDGKMCKWCKYDVGEIDIDDVVVDDDDDVNVDVDVDVEKMAQKM